MAGLIGPTGSDRVAAAYRLPSACAAPCPSEDALPLAKLPPASSVGATTRTSCPAGRRSSQAIASVRRASAEDELMIAGEAAADIASSHTTCLAQIITEGGIVPHEEFLRVELRERRPGRLGCRSAGRK